MQKYSEDQLIGMIQSGGRALDDAMSYIYRDSRIRLKVLNFMMSKKASREEAEDVFQDSVKILILSIRKGSFRGESTIKNYLFGICKKVLQSQRVTKDRRVTLSQQIEFETEEKQTPERAFMLQERREILNKLLSEIGEKCQKVLQMWRLDYSMSEIADSMGYKSDGMARKKKHECMKKLILKVQSNPGLLSDLK